MYLRLTNTYFWPNMKKDIQDHIDSCLQCQVWKKSTAKPTPLQPLPTVDQPNQPIHIDLFGPLKTSAQNGFGNDICFQQICGGNCNTKQRS